MSRKLVLGATLFFVTTSGLAGQIPDPNIPDTYIQTGRYSAVINEPMLAQKNPLKVLVQTKVPSTVHTLEQTFNFLLNRSGYTLADRSVMKPETLTLLGHTLPDVHRTIGPITLDKALKFLAGDSYEMVVDPINRKISFVPALDIQEATNEPR